MKEAERLSFEADKFEADKFEADKFEADKLESEPVLAAHEVEPVLA